MEIRVNVPFYLDWNYSNHCVVDEDLENFIERMENSIGRPLDYDPDPIVEGTYHLELTNQPNEIYSCGNDFDISLDALMYLKDMGLIEILDEAKANVGLVTMTVKEPFYIDWIFRKNVIFDKDRGNFIKRMVNLNLGFMEDNINPSRLEKGTYSLEMIDSVSKLFACNNGLEISMNTLLDLKGAGLIDFAW